MYNGQRNIDIEPATTTEGACGPYILSHNGNGQKYNISMLLLREG